MSMILLTDALVSLFDLTQRYHIYRFDSIVLKLLGESYCVDFEIRLNKLTKI